MAYKNNKKNMALIDGEIIAFHLVTNKAHLREESNELDEFYEVLDMESVKNEFDERLKTIMHETKSNQYIFFFGSKENFRKKVDPSYKANRNKSKPLGYWALVTWITANYSTQSYPKIEADDAMGIAHTKSLAKTIMVSSDKDMKTIPGLLYDHTRPENGVVDISEQEAAAWWGYQTLVGDTADGYKGCPGVGAVGAKPLLEKFKQSKLKGTRLDRAIFKEVCSYFYEAGLSEKDALTQARLSRILRSGEYDFKTNKPILWKP